MLAFGFANLAILGWLAAAAAPLLIHLWMRRVRKETRWAAVRFLQAAIKRHARRLQLEQWILLAIRTAIIVLIVLAAAKPVLDSLGLVGPGVRTHRLIVVDTSMSMGYQTEDGRLIERAKRLATQLVEESRSGDVFTVCTLASPPRTLLAQPTSERTRAKDAIQSLDVTEGSAQLAQCLATLDQALARAEESATRVDRHEVSFFTDLTATTWADLVADAPAEQGAAESQRLYAELIETAVLSIVDVGEPDAANTAVVAARVEDPTPTVRRPVALRAQVQAFGGEPGEQLVELVADGVTVDSQNVRLDDRGVASVAFAHQFRTPGLHALAVRIAGDKLPADDRRWLAPAVLPYVRVLCVEGRTGAAQYVVSALNPAGDADSPIRPEVVSDASLAGIEFSDYQCVFFCNVAQLSRDEAQRVERYVRGGGGAVFFLGDRVLPTRYNEVLGPGDAGGGAVTRSRRGQSPAAGEPASPFKLLGAETAGVRLASQATREGLLPAAIGEAVTNPQYRLDPLEYAHPIVAPFRGRERAGLITTPVSRYFKLTPASSGDSEVALATPSGDPLIVTARRERGRVVLCATAGSLASVDPTTGEPWTVMPAWPSFLPIVRELLDYATGADSDEPGVLVGEPIGGHAGVPAGGEAIVRRPGGDEEPVSLREAARGVAWEYDRTDVGGVYQVTAPGAPAALAMVAVNTNPRESDLARVPTSEMPAELRVRRVAAQAGGGAELVAPTGVHRPLLLAALGLVLLETFLAYVFARSNA